MITRANVNAALDDWVAAERERLGGPPSPEEVVAYLSGELTEPDAARVRALLVYYPELTPLLDETVREPAGRSRALGIAAGLLIALLAGLLAQSRWELARMERQPYLHANRHQLRSIRIRGTVPPPYPLPPDEQRYLLALTLIDQRTFTDYRIAVVDLSTSEIVWTRTGVRPVRGVFELSVPRAFLHPGSYRIDVHGLEAGRAHLLDSFGFHLPHNRSEKVSD